MPGSTCVAIDFISTFFFLYDFVVKAAVMTAPEDAEATGPEDVDVTTGPEDTTARARFSRFRRQLSLTLKKAIRKQKL